MRRSDVIETLTAAAVVLGLVFVGLELRQNTTIQRITTTQTLAQQYSDALAILSESGDAACVYALGINGLDNLDDAERLQFFAIWYRIMRSAEQLHYYAIDGMVEDRIWRGFDRQLDELSTLPGVQEWWDVRRGWFSDAFQQYFAAKIAAGSTLEAQRYTEHSCLETAP